MSNKERINCFHPETTQERQSYELYEQQFLQKPRPLKIGDGIKLRNPRGFSIEPVDTKTYEVLEFLDKGDIRIREIFSKKERIINSGRIGEVIHD